MIIQLWPVGVGSSAILHQIDKHDSNLDVTQKMALKKAPFERGLLKIAIGAEDEIRTRDFLLGKEVLYH